MALQADIAAPSGLSLDSHVLASRMSLFEKLFRIQQDLSTGSVLVDGSPNNVSEQNAPAGSDGSPIAHPHSLPGIGGALAPVDTLPGLTTYNPAAPISFTSQQPTQPPINGTTESGRDESPEDGEIQTSSTPAFDPVLLQKSDALIQAEKKLEMQRAARGPAYWAEGKGKSLKISDPRDYPYIDVEPILTAAQALVPPVSGLRAGSTKTFNTESYYSSRGSWSARGSPGQATGATVPGLIRESSNASVTMEISSNEEPADGKATVQGRQSVVDDNEYSPGNPPVGYMQHTQTPPYAADKSWYGPEPTGRAESAYNQASRTVPEAIEILTDDEHIVDSLQNAPSAPIFGGNCTIHDESTSSRSEVAVQPIEEEDDYEPDSDFEDEYEPPAADAFHTEEPGTRMPLAPIKPYPFARKPGQKSRNFKSGNQRPKPQQPAKKRRRVDYPADPRKRVQKQLPYDTPITPYPGPSSSDAFIKQEPVSPPPLLPQGRVPLPETPPSVARRQSGYGSDFNGYDSSDRGMEPPTTFYESGGHIVRRKQPIPPDVRASRAGTYYPTVTQASTDRAPYNRGWQNEVEEVPPPVPRPRTAAAPPAHDPLRIIAIGSHTGKLYYNRKMRPGDTIPAPAPDLPRIDDTPKAAPPLVAVAEERAMSAFPEPRRTVSLHDRLYAEPPAPRPEHRVASYGSAQRAYSAYPEPAPARSYSVHPEEMLRTRYETPPYAREEYERREASPQTYEYPPSIAYTARPERIQPADSQLSYPRTYNARPEFAIPAIPERTVARAYSVRPAYAPPKTQPSYTYEYAARASTARPEPRAEPSALAAYHERAAEYWAKPPVPERVFKDPYPPRTHAAATFARSQSVNPLAYDPAASIQAYAPQSSSSPRAMMPPPPVPAYTREYSHQPRHASAAPWQ